MTRLSKFFPQQATPASRSLLAGPVLGMLFLFTSATGLASEMDDQDLERAVQNPLLWSYFSSVARDLHTGYDGFGRKHRAVHGALDAQTEALIESFLKRVNRQSWELAAAGEQLVELVEGTRPISAKERQERLKALQSAARSLRSTLSPVYAYDTHRGRAPRDGSQEEPDLEELAQLVFSTYRAIQGYLFQGQHTVTVERLQDENILMCLSRVQEMARRLERQSSDD